MHKSFRAAALAAVFLLAACGSDDERVVVPVPAAASDSSTTQRINAWFEHYNDGKQPGVAVLAISGADILFKDTYGYADIANDVLVNDDSLFRLASVSKQFTAAAIVSSSSCTTTTRTIRTAFARASASPPRTPPTGGS